MASEENKLIKQITPIGSIKQNGIVIPNHSGDYSCVINKLYATSPINFVSSDKTKWCRFTISTGSSSVFLETANSLRITRSGTAALTIAGANGICNTSSDPAASSVFDFSSTSKGLLLPRMTTAQKNAISSPATGLIVYDTSLNKLCVYTGAAWETITSA